ncbi:MucB/RseB-like sigma(E) regulatory protein [Alteromonadaceae bacterium 2753L.S.0a.02]|nr:MucB/RseB-like sigma(E) regulatory protein [Alteromonadaceae bacterium 2753L.S.0a.02]
MRTYLRAVAKFSALICFFSLPLTVYATVTTERSADQILSRLSSAMRELSYQGVLTFEHGGRMETMHTAHLVIDGVEFESYTHLNGPERQHARIGREVSCETLGGRLLSGAVLANGKGTQRFQDYYQFYLKGYDRVAGRKVAVLQILPKDQHRYGMSLGVDVESGVLLKYLIMLPNRALERIQFVAFELQPDYSDAELQQFTNNATLLRPCRPPEVAQVAQISSDFDWAPTWQPPGFVLAGSHLTEQDGMVYTYTDGLSSYSVFINPDLVKKGDSDTKIPQGVAQRGATLVLMSLQSIGNEYVHVSLVGEVPEQTAGMILNSVAHRGGSGISAQ